MKIIAIVALAAVVGLAAGVGTALWEVNSCSEHLRPIDKQAESPKLPRLEIVGGSRHYFGAMAVGETAQHAFEIKNVGEAPVVLIPGKTTCVCTMSDLKESVLGPGQSTQVELSWHPTDAKDEFAQAADVYTTAPNMPYIEFQIMGRVLREMRSEPLELVLGGLDASESRTLSVDLCNYERPFKIKSIEMAAAETAEYFTVNSRPFSTEELEKKPDAVAGYRLTVTIRPGLPPGPLDQKIRVHTDSPFVAEYGIPVTGDVSKSASLVGRGYDAGSGLLALGKISASRGKLAQLRLIVRGPHRQSAAYEVAEVEPAALSASIGERRELSEGGLVQFIIQIEVPPQLDPIDRSGSGEASPVTVRLKSNQPQLDDLEFRVSFVIVPD